MNTYIFDFDSTIVSVESLDELARIAFAGRPDAAEQFTKLSNITNLGMTGAIDFRESLTQRLQLFAPTKEEIKTLVDLLMQSITPSFVRQSQWLRKNSHRIYIVSGGFEECIKPVAKQLGIPESHVFANRFVYDNHGNATGFEPSHPTSQPQGKVTQIKTMRLPGKTVMVGDGFTDYEARKFGAVDLFWAYTEIVTRDVVTQNADRTVHSLEDIIQLDTGT